MRWKASLAGCLVSGSAFALAPPAMAGDLNPPAGAVSPTMKDLDDVSPRRIIRNDFDTLTPIVINSSGSYYLGEDIFALPNQHGIQIAVSDVTLDLNGFSVIGNTEVGSLDGVVVTGANRTGVVVRNGRVKSFFGAGVNFGLSVNGIVRDVVVDSCGGRGISVWNDSMIDNCRSLNNGGDGFFLNDDGVVVDCYARNNTGDGFNTDGSCEVRRSIAENNTGDGFRGGADTRFLGCTAVGSNGSGFHLTFQRGVIMDCVSKFNNIGFDVDQLNNTIVRNISHLDTTPYDVVANNDFGTVSNTPVGAGAWDNLEL